MELDGYVRELGLMYYQGNVLALYGVPVAELIDVLAIMYNKSNRAKRPTGGDRTLPGGKRVKSIAFKDRDHMLAMAGGR